MCSIELMLGLCRSYNTLALVHSVAFIFVASIAGPVFILLFVKKYN
jgi:hypothetical protein